MERRAESLTRTRPLAKPSWAMAAHCVLAMLQAPSEHEWLAIEMLALACDVVHSELGAPEVQ